MKTQVTQPQYDERFYYREIPNSSSGGFWYPSVTYILKYAPADPNLIKWIAEHGTVIAEQLKVARGTLGSIVHDFIEQMVKYGRTFTPKDVDKTTSDPKDQLFLNRCMEGFMNFLEEHKPIFLGSEEEVYGDDYAGTRDLRVLIGGVEHVLDTKTSKYVVDHHKIQVEAYRRASDLPLGGILHLGNQTKKRFTLSIVKPDRQDYYWNIFQAIKSVYYAYHPTTSSVAPTTEVFPDEYYIDPILLAEINKDESETVE